MNSPIPGQEVKVTDVRMPFGSMVLFTVKWAIASIPALVILIVAGAAFWGVAAGFLGSLVNPSRRVVTSTMSDTVSPGPLVVDSVAVSAGSIGNESSVSKRPARTDSPTAKRPATGDKSPPKRAANSAAAASTPPTNGDSAAPKGSGVAKTPRSKRSTDNKIAAAQEQPTARGAAVDSIQQGYASQLQTEYAGQGADAHVEVRRAPEGETLYITGSACKRSLVFNLRDAMLAKGMGRPVFVRVACHNSTDNSNYAEKF
jgi:hypothetical protein